MTNETHTIESLEDQLSNYDGYPERPTRPKAPTGDEPKKFREHARALEDYARLQEEYQARLKEYNAGRSKLQEQWEEMLFASHPKHPEPVKRVIYGVAYDRAHSSGWQSVRHEFDSLVDLIDDVMKAGGLSYGN